MAFDIKQTTVWKLMHQESMSAENFDYEALTAPPLLYYLSMEDIEYFHKIAKSVRLASKTRQKYQMIDEVMQRRGFTLLSRGTNRVVYKHYEDPYIVVKIAICEGALMDNPREFYNQNYLKPFCCKVFEVSPCGTVALVERVYNLKNKDDLIPIAEDLYVLLTYFILGQFVLDDIGIKHFLNYGIREGFGPVLLDYPYMYLLDGNKIYCQEMLPNREICGGEINYDATFDNLLCEKCGMHYYASQLGKSIDMGQINQISKNIFDQIHITVKRGDKIIKEVNTMNTRKKIERP